MRFIEIRRHSARSPAGSELTQAGIALARRLGENAGPFHRVITSPLSRARDTAAAMGFPPQQQTDLLLPPDGNVCAQVDWESSFADFGSAVLSGGPAAVFAAELAGYLKRLAESMPDGESALVIAHGGTVELAAVGCLPLADHRSWGGPCGFCEGARLAYDGSDFVAAEILRVFPYSG